VPHSCHGDEGKAGAVEHNSSGMHSTLITFGKPCPVSDLFGVAGRKLLARLQVPEPWRENVEASVVLIDQLRVDDQALSDLPALVDFLHMGEAGVMVSTAPAPPCSPLRASPDGRRL
jgi:hypothetical protein